MFMLVIVNSITKNSGAWMIHVHSSSLSYIPSPFLSRDVTKPMALSSNPPHSQVTSGTVDKSNLIVNRPFRLIYTQLRSNHMVIKHILSKWFCARLFICALWSPAGKGLTSWLSFVVSSVSLSLSHWYPGSGVVLDCIDS